MQDGGGLIFELTESGGRRVARAVYRFRLNGKRPDMRLGTWPDRTLADIRTARDAARDLVKAGRDPREVAREEKAAAAAQLAQDAARLTVAGAFAKWDALHLRRAFKDGGAEVRRYFEHDVLPALGGLPMEDLTRAHVARVVDGALERNAPRSAQLLLGYLRQFCRWSLARGYLDADPSAALSKASIKTNGPRERVLTDDELRELARLLPEADLPPWAPPAVWLLLATAARVGELLGARWEDFDMDARTWTIPAERSKNGRAHVVDLSSFAVARLAELETLRSGPWLVAGRKLKDGATAGPVDEKGLSKLLKDRQRPEGYKPLANRRANNLQALILPRGAWTPHDLRRTAATMLQALGVAPAVIERCLNHTEPRRLVAVYQRFDYRPERRDAFNRLGTHLEALAHGEAGRVVALAPGMKRNRRTVEDPLLGDTEVVEFRWERGDPPHELGGILRRLAPPDPLAMLGDMEAICEAFLAEHPGATDRQAAEVEKALRRLASAREHIERGEADAAFRDGFLAGDLMRRADLRPLEKPLGTGRKVRAAQKAAHEGRHGTPEEKNARWSKMVADFEARANEWTGNTETLLDEIANAHGCNKKTVTRAIERIRKTTPAELRRLPRQK